MGESHIIIITIAALDVGKHTQCRICHRVNTIHKYTIHISCTLLRFAENVLCIGHDIAYTVVDRPYYHRL